MTKKRAILCAVGLLLSVGALFGLWCSVPHITKWYVLRNYPYIKSIESIDVHWMWTEVYGVKVEKEKITADIKYIRINTEKEIEVIGGTANVHSLSKREGGVSKGWKIKVSNLDVFVDAVGVSGEAHGVSYKEGKICFASGKAVYKGILGSFGHGCTRPSQKRGYVDKIQAMVKLPKFIPHVEKKQKIKAEDVRFHWGRKEIGVLKLWVGDVLYMQQARLFLDKQYVRVQVLSINFKHPWLADNVVNHVSIVVPQSLDGTITMQTSHNREGEGRIVEINVEPRKHKIWGAGQCADWMLDLPNIPAIHDGGYSKISGRFEFEIDANSSTIKLKNKCKIKCNFKPISSLMKKFSYNAIDDKGKVFERVTGLNTSGWVFIETLPTYVPEAFIRMEDPGFRHHRGVLRKALEVSLEINMDKGKFVRGGSTITMQLVKNLWLGRQKTLDRKLAEIILAHMLEGCFIKDQILEFYMNVVEFAPNVYGIRGGAWHYFQKVPQDLSPEEAVYLARVLPKPKKPRDPERGIDNIRKMIKLWKETGVLPKDFGNEKRRPSDNQ